MEALFFIGAIILVWAVWIVRIEIVYSNAQRAVDYIYGDHRDNWRELRDRHLGGKFSFLALCVDLRKWTYRQMFPGLEEENHGQS